MNRRIASISSILLALATFVTGSILPALHRHDAATCCTRSPGESKRFDLGSTLRESSNWFGDHAHSHVDRHDQLSCDDKSTVVTRSGENQLAPFSSYAFTSGGNDHDANGCTICRFLGQQRVTLTDAVVISSANLDGQLAILAIAAPDFRTLLVARSRGPPVVS